MKNRLLALWVAMALLAFSGCSAAPTAMPQPTATPTRPATATMTASPTRTPTVTPRSVPTDSYRYVASTPWYTPGISRTQLPVKILSAGDAHSGFLYRNALVELGYADERYLIDYLNLDDLDDNSATNCDIMLERSVGSGGSFFDLYSVNGAVYHRATDGQTDFASCLAYFPTTDIDEMLESSDLGWSFMSGDFICVITNEGRMAVIQYQEDSSWYTEDFTNYFSVLVTVYDQILK